MIHSAKLLDGTRKLNSITLQRSRLILNSRFCGLSTNRSENNLTAKEAVSPSYQFNKNKTNPTTLRQLIYQLFFPSVQNNGQGGSSKVGTIQQILSIFKNPGLHESLYRLKQKTISISKATDPSNQYDYIVVGAGSAGCALAYRLATSHLSSSTKGTLPRKKVLLIEAGPKDTNPWIHIPVGYFKTLHNSSIGWGYKIEEETSGLDGRGIAWPRAKVLGGCSSVNGLLWVRGIPQDYDNWDDVSGSHGIWTWERVKENFKTLEGHMAVKNDSDKDRNVEDAETFGSNGPITIEDTRYKTGLCNAFIRACEKELKLVKRTKERINLMQEEKESERLGFCSVLRSVGMGVVGYYQLSTNNGFRSSSAVGYLNRANRLAEDISLDVLTGYNVDRILFKENKLRSTGSVEAHKYRTIGVELSEHQKSSSILNRFFHQKLRFSPENSKNCQKVNILLKNYDCNEIPPSLPEEVILSAGVIGSPHILQLSGIGFDETKSIDGKIYSFLKGVGKNLQDHLQIRLVYQCPSNIPTLNTTLKYPWHYLRVGIEYALYQSGPLSMAASSVAAFVNSRKFVFSEKLCQVSQKTNSHIDIDLSRKIPEEELDGVSRARRFGSSPDIQYHLQPLSSAIHSPGKGFDPMSAFTASVCQLRPTSTGWIEVVSNNPQDKPKIHANYITTKVDEDCVVRAVELTRQLCLRSESMKKYVEHELVPIKGLTGENISGKDSEGHKIDTSENLHDYNREPLLNRENILKQAKQVAESIYHPVGTCKMGNFRSRTNDHEIERCDANKDDLSVVDPLLRVHGISNLRVADASIMPQITSGNTNAPSIMIGEKCAELILNGHTGERRQQ